MRQMDDLEKSAETMKDAGVLLNEDALDQVSGGSSVEDSYCPLCSRTHTLTRYSDWRVLVDQRVYTAKRYLCTNRHAFFYIATVHGETVYLDDRMDRIV